MVLIYMYVYVFVYIYISLGHNFSRVQSAKNICKKSSAKVLGEGLSLGVNLNAIRYENISLMFAKCWI